MPFCSSCFHWPFMDHFIMEKNSLAAAIWPEFWPTLADFEWDTNSSFCQLTLSNFWGQKLFFFFCVQDWMVKSHLGNFSWKKTSLLAKSVKINEHFYLATCDSLTKLLFIQHHVVCKLVFYFNSNAVRHLISSRCLSCTEKQTLSNPICHILFRFLCRIITLYSLIWKMNW